MEFPKRKNIKLKDYDYSQPGAYFITISVKERKTILSEITVGANSVRPNEIRLTKYGEIVESAINNIPKCYPNVTVDNHVIMPDHIHLLLQLHSDNNGQPIVAPIIDSIIKQTKGYITKQIGFSIWQKSYNNHIIRCEKDYKEIWNYINTNPEKRNKDCFYV